MLCCHTGAGETLLVSIAVRVSMPETMEAVTTL